MDPITKAAHRFMRDVGHFLRTRGKVSLRIIAPPERRADVGNALRLLEHARDNRHVFCLFDEPFDDAGRYFLALERFFVQRANSIPLHGIDGPVATNPMERAAFVMNSFVTAQPTSVEGVVAALVPRRVTDPAAFGEALHAFLKLPLASGLRILVGGHVDAFHVDARLDVSHDQLFAYVRSLIPSSVPDSPSSMTLDAWRALAAGDFPAAAREQASAVTLAYGRGHTRELAAVLVARAGIALACGDAAGARGVLSEAALMAEHAGLHGQSVQAFRALALLAQMDGERPVADVAARAANDAQERAFPSKLVP